MIENKIPLTVTAVNLNRIYWVLFLAPVIILIFVHTYNAGISGVWREFVSINTFYYISIFILICIMHEAFHVLAGLIVGAKLNSFNFGFDKSTLSIECYCRDEMSISGYQFFLVLPFLVLTPLLVAGAYFYESSLLWIMLALSTSGCAFDLTVLVGLHGIPGCTRIVPEFFGENGQVYLHAVPH